MNMQARDIRHLWHPYTDMVAFEQQTYLCVEKAEGIYLYLNDGRKLIDGIASWWCVNLGHSRPEIVRAIQEQAAILQHAMIGGMSHGPAVALAERLAQMAPGDLNRVFFGADGSSVVEAALKLAVQFWGLEGKPEKARFISLEDAYHGDTIGAMEVGYIHWFAEAYGAILKPAMRAPSPHYRGEEGPAAEAHLAAAIAGLEALLEAEHETVAGLILEPLIQGAAGVRIYPAAYLTAARALCDRYEVLLILDEVATGFWRTGAAFACDVAGITPDILCLGKGLTGGSLPLSALVATERIYRPFVPSEGGKVFWDGHTFCGNPITCAAALAALDLYEGLDKEALAVREAALGAGMKRLAAHPAVAYSRSVGMAGMVALREEAGGAALAKAVCNRAIASGLYVRPLGEVIYLWPPLIIDGPSLEESLNILGTALEALATRMRE